MTRASVLDPNNRSDQWIVDEPVPVDVLSAQQLLETIVATQSGLALTAHNLLREFGPSTLLTRQFATSLLNRLDEVLGHDPEGLSAGRSTNRRRQCPAQAAGWARFVSIQNRYNLLNREEKREMIPVCLDQGVGLTPRSPLARGMLAGIRDRGGERNTIRSRSDPYADELYGEDDFDVVDAVRAVADVHGRPPAQIALAWPMGKSAVTATDLTRDRTVPQPRSWIFRAMWGG
jgi:hypothetical protein